MRGIVALALVLATCGCSDPDGGGAGATPAGSSPSFVGLVLRGDALLAKKQGFTQCQGTSRQLVCARPDTLVVEGQIAPLVDLVLEGTSDNETNLSELKYTSIRFKISRDTVDPGCAKKQGADGGSWSEIAGPDCDRQSDMSKVFQALKLKGFEDISGRREDRFVNVASGVRVSSFRRSDILEAAPATSLDLASVEERQAEAASIQRATSAASGLVEAMKR